jgi:hypothetical protein
MRGGMVGVSSIEPLGRPCAQRRVKSPLEAPVGAMAPRYRIRRRRFQAGQVAAPAGGVAVEQEVHRQLFVADADIALLVDGAGGAIRRRQLRADSGGARLEEAAAAQGHRRIPHRRRRSGSCDW